MFCLITPIFDGCCESLSLLIQDLQKQTYTDFIQVSISNGPSVIVKQLLEKINDNRFIYHELPQEDTSTPIKLIENLGKRRNFCMKNYDAERYFFFDADLKIIDNDFFSKVKKITNIADIVISNIVHGKMLYPIRPLGKGNIDLANYSISKKLADQYDYPTQYDCNYDIAFDWRFFSSMLGESKYFSNVTYAIKNGHNNYKTVCRIYLDWINKIT